MDSDAARPIPRKSRPGDVLNDRSMSNTEKREYLEKWRLDLLERVRATEENMAASGTVTDELSEQLRDVNNALTELRES
jgi:hypothetical protein